MNNAVIYARYSSSSQDEQTIEMQLKRCREFANNNDLVVIDEYTDEAKSGRNGNRDGLQQILIDSKKKKFQYVIMYMSDRYFRNTMEALTFEKELNKNGVKLLYTIEKFDDSPFGNYMKIMSYANAQLYSDMFAIKIASGLENNASKFLSTGSGIPFGYKTIDKKIYIDEETAPYVKEIFEMYSRGKTMADIIRYLNSLNIKTKRNGNFNKSSITRILKNRRYLGIYIFRDKETPGKMPKIIDDDLFYNVQMLLEKNKKAPGRRRAKEDYILTTKLFCGECKEMMTGLSGTSKTGKLHSYYSCKNARNKSCIKHNVKKDYLEDIVFDEITKVLTSDNINEIAVNVVKITESLQDFSKLNQINKSIKKLEKKKSNLISAVSECDSASIRKSLYDEITVIENEYNQLLKDKYEEEKNKIKLTVPQVKFFLVKLMNKSHSNIKARKALIEVLINKIYLYNDRMIIIFNTQDKEMSVDIDVIEESKSSSIDSSSPP